MSELRMSLFLRMMVLGLTLCGETCCWAFEYETTQFTSAVFNYSYTKEDKRWVASDDAVKYYTGKWGSLNPVALLHKRIAGHGFAPSLTYFHGCDYDDIDLPSDHLEFNDLIVVVRKGGECSLWDKLLLASNMNFSALIEYDSDSDVEMEGLSDYAADSERGESPIVYALAIKPFGSFVEDLYRNGSHPHLSLAAGQTTIMRIGVNKTSVLFVATSFVVLTIISLAWLLFYYVQRFRYLHSRDRTKKRLAAAAKKALTLLQVKILKKGINEISEEDNCCSICIDDFQYGDAVRELPCSHKFHRACVDPWLVSHYNCPNCKTNVLKALNLIDKVNLPRTQEDEENSVGGSSSAGGIAMTTPVVAPGVGGRGASSGIGNGGGGRMSLVLSITVPSTPPDDDNQDNNDWLRSHCMIPSTSSSATNPTAVTKNNAEKNGDENEDEIQVDFKSKVENKLMETVNNDDALLFTRSQNNEDNKSKKVVHDDVTSDVTDKVDDVIYAKATPENEQQNNDTISQKTNQNENPCDQTEDKVIENKSFEEKLSNNESTSCNSIAIEVDRDIADKESVNGDRELSVQNDNLITIESAAVHRGFPIPLTPNASPEQTLDSGVNPQTESIEKL